MNITFNSNRKVFFTSNVNDKNNIFSQNSLSKENSDTTLSLESNKLNMLGRTDVLLAKNDSLANKKTGFYAPLNKDMLEKFQAELKSYYSYDDDTNEKRFRFSSYDISDLANVVNCGNISLAKKLLKTSCGSDSMQTFTYDSYDIFEILKLSNEKNVQVLEKLVTAQDVVDNLSVPRFSVKDIKDILNLDNDDFEFASQFVQQTNFNFNNINFVLKNTPKDKIQYVLQLGSMLSVEDCKDDIKIIKTLEIAKKINDKNKNYYEKCLSYCKPDMNGDCKLTSDDTMRLIELIVNNKTQFSPDEIFEKIDYFTSDEFKNILQKKINNPKMMENIENIFLTKPIPFPIDDFLSLNIPNDKLVNPIKQMSKSTLKLALETPNQYLSSIPIEHTKKVDGKYIKLPNEINEIYKNKVVEFFKSHSIELLRASYYLDKDTVNQLMDKRTELFADDLSNLNNLTDDNYELLSKLITYKSTDNNNKPLKASEKIELCHFVEIIQNVDLNFDIIKNSIKDDSISLSKIKSDLQNEIFKNVGLTESDIKNVPKNKLNFNPKYSYLILSNVGIEEINNHLADEFQSYVTRLRYMDNDELADAIEFLQVAQSPDLLSNKQRFSDEYLYLQDKMLDMYKHIENYTDEEFIDTGLKMLTLLQQRMLGNEVTRLQCNDDNMQTLIKASVLGNFHDFINDENNKYGQTNALTKKIFEQNGIDYDKWIKPEVPDINFDINNKNMTIKMWDRNPQEDLFLGNKTNCCTAIGVGANGKAMPIYLLNTSFNVIELFDEKGDVVGMSRVFMSKVDGKPSVIMDNIELANDYRESKISDCELDKIRDNFFKYMNNYAKQITGDKNTQVYMFASDLHVKLPLDKYETKSMPLKFIGNLSDECVYFNSAESWINPFDKNRDSNAHLFVKVPKNVE